MPTSKLQILYEDNHLLAVVKPAGMATMGVSDDKPSVLSLAKDYIKRRYNKPGNVYLGVMSRLDAPVSGVVLFARTSKAAARLTEQFRTHAVEKTYWAVVEGILEPAVGSFTDYLGKDEQHQRMQIVGATLPGAKLANLTYRRTDKTSKANRWSRLHFRRGESIKFDCSLRIMVIRSLAIGNMAVGGVFPRELPCYARRLVITHPIKGDRIIFRSPFT